MNLHKVTGRGDLAFDLRFRGPRPWADLCNVKYIIEHVEDPGHLKAYSEQAYRVLRDVRIDSGGDNQRFVLLENETCFPRVFLLTGANRQQVAQILRDPEDGLPDMISNEMFDVLRPYHAVSVTREIDRYRVDYSADQPGFLFLGEMYDAGWRARVDGAAAKITAPFGFFMGLHVPSGAHTVVFEYRPLHTYVFWLVSALTLVASVAITAVVSIKGRQDATARVR